MVKDGSKYRFISGMRAAMLAETGFIRAIAATVEICNDSRVKFKEVSLNMYDDLGVVFVFGKYVFIQVSISATKVLQEQHDPCCQRYL